MEKFTHTHTHTDTQSHYIHRLTCMQYQQVKVYWSMLYNYLFIYLLICLCFTFIGVPQIYNKGLGGMELKKKWTVS